MKSKQTHLHAQLYGFCILFFSLVLSIVILSFPSHVDALFATIFAPASIPFNWVARATALGDTTQLTFLGILFLNFPLGSWLNGLQSKVTKIWMSFLVGIFYCFFVYNWGAFAIVQWVLISYALLLVLPRRYSHLVVFFVGMGFLSLCHIYRMVFREDYMTTSIDFTGSLMLILFKSFMFAFNYHDGAHADDPTYSPTVTSALRRLPSLVDYMSYCFFFQTVLTGPIYDFVTFDDHLELGMLKRYNLKDFPGRKRDAMKKFGWFLVGVGLFFIGQAFPRGFYLSDEFMEYSLLSRLGMMWIILQGFKGKYYLSWYLAESGCAWSGFSFNGFKDKANLSGPRYDRVQSADLLGCDFATSVKETSTKWNISVAKFLKYYIFMRTTPYGKAPTVKSHLAAFFTSSFWHGFYPGYYLFFMFGPPVYELKRLIHKHIYPLFTSKNKRIDPFLRRFYSLLCVLLMNWHVGYYNAAFMLLRLDQSLFVYKRVYFMGHITIGGSFIGLSLWDIMRTRWRRRKVSKKRE